MKNIIDEGPPAELHGRLAFTAEQWVEPRDIARKTVLNIGTGLGWFEEFVATEGGYAVGVEKEPDLVENARKHLEGFDIRQGSAMELPCGDKSFDTVTCWEVIEHLPKFMEPHLFREAARVLKPGGVFYLSTPNFHPVSMLLDPAYWLNGHRHYCWDGLEALGKDFGFTLAQYTTAGGWLEIADIWNLYIAKWIFRRKRFFERTSLRFSDRSYQGDGFNTLFMKFRKP